MRRRYASLFVAFVALVATIIAVPSSSTVFAQSANAANGLEISPVLSEIVVDKGGTYSVDINVHNVSISKLYFDASVDDFGPKDETGTPSIILDTTKEPLVTSIKSWVQYIPSFILAPNEKTTIKATITVPDDAEPGGHYGVVRFAGREQQAGTGGVGLIASAGTLMLITVKGDAKESLTLASFETTKDSKQTNWFETSPVTFVSRFTNDGSVHVKPIGQIEIKDTFGKPVTTLPVNDAKGNVLPGGTRRFESTLNKPWMFGHYTADLSIAYGTTGQAIVSSISFWIIPWKLVLAGLFITATIIYILRILVVRYNKYIINRYGSTNSTKNNKKNKK